MLKLQELWHQIAGGLPDPQRRAGDLWAHLDALYTQEHRHYHTWAHISDFFQKSRLLVPSAVRSQAFDFACFYHDAVYDTQRKDNEELSAALCEQSLLELGAPPSLIDQSSILVKSTKAHLADGVNPIVVHYFLDCDLAILGSADEDYDRYTQQIRREYGWVSPVLYVAGRSRVLKSFAKRDCIYFTEAFRFLFEAQARRNLNRELQSLSQ